MSSHWTPVVNVLEEMSELGMNTRAASSQIDEERNPRPYPLTQPIVHAATYKFKSIEHYEQILEQGGYIYSRLGNPSVEAVECTITALEGGAGTLMFSSGSAALFTLVMANVKAGDHVICQNPIYSGVYKIFSKIIVNYGIDVSFVRAGSPVSEYEKLIRPNTKLIHVESPCNPMNTMVDLAALGALGARCKVLTSVDNTFLSSALLQPLKYGLDMVMHSCTKYMSGNNDLVAGCVTTKTLDMWKKLNVFRATVGVVSSPFDANLLLRGLKTLPLRMERHSSNALRVARFLEAQDKVAKVYYPGLESFPQHGLAKQQLCGRGYGGMVTLEMKGGYEAAKRLVEGVRLIHLAVSLGDVRSFINHPASMTHGKMVMTDGEREEAEITEGLIRLSVGVEDVEDLERDLQQALEKV